MKNYKNNISKDLGLFLIYSITILCLFSCSSEKDIIYFQNKYSYKSKNIDYKERYIQPNDILKIEIGSTIPEAAIPYNKMQASGSNVTSLEQMQLNGYVVDLKSQIELPTLGTVSVKNLTLSMLENKLKNILIENMHLENPTISTRILNSKVTVLGEVKTPGTFYITEPRITILQALGLAGDLTINGKREEVLLIREIEGKRKTIHINLKDIRLLEEPYYEIQSNDIIIVQPNYSKVKSAGFIGSPGTILSVASLIISITILLTN
ncbi:polysaccharide biosynthesis/export family protein [Wenyingzhuangia sp. IMCC45574]